jgi:hypothetical protein
MVRQWYVTGATAVDFDDLPTDAPGGDCPETGPYADDDDE